MENGGINDLNLIIGLIEGVVTTAGSFNSLSVYRNMTDQDQVLAHVALAPGVETLNSANVFWQE